MTSRSRTGVRNNSRNTFRTAAIAISWAPYSRRSRMFARDLDIPLHCIHNLRFQSKPYAPFKYVIQAVRTLWVLSRVRPGAVHVQNPPCFCGLVVAAYCRVARARYVLDHHSAAFLPIWDRFGVIQRWVVRGAATNVVTSEHWAEVVHEWGGDTLVMSDAFRELPPGREATLTPGPNVAFVGTFAFDEPLDVLLDAAASLPAVQFHVTGDTRVADPAVLAGAPPNVTFTGFRPYDEYLGLLRAVDAVIALTTRDHTLQGAGCEAISLGTPLVTSDWPYLREVFEGMVFVAAEPDAVRAGIVEVLDRRGELAAAAAALRERRRARWKEQLVELERRMGLHDHELVEMQAQQEEQR
ncbi:MAG TPA: glycosyltransferase family 4 protein [Acidimicrobiia bacterium]|jgi:glycosyltransferase involved in cell wall biosynthesis